MRNYPVFDSASQNEALINEFKGNLFEFLVGMAVARHSEIEADFLRSIDQDLSSRLRSYEDWLWQNDDALALKLPILADAAAKRLIEFNSQKFERVVVMGKLAGGSHDDSFGEADLLLIGSGEKITPVSLKLCRKGAFVNTKSAGIRSFLSKYFAEIPNIDLAQERVNLVLDESFGEFSQALHLRHGLAEQSSFSNDWKNANLPQLPGALEKVDQDLLQQHYYRIITLIYNTLKEAFENQRQLFDDSLASILGLKPQGLIQLTCFHNVVADQRYELDHIELIEQAKRLKQLNEAKLVAPVEGQASFAIEYPWGTLQIRVKPMNKFTQAALKVNCSVRHAK